MEHSFNIELAKEYGILEAILLKNIWFWIEKKRANEKNLNITSLNVYIETEDENRYGMLNSLVMKVEKNETSKKNNDVNQIKEINISKNVQNNEIIEREEGNLVNISATIFFYVTT